MMLYMKKAFNQFSKLIPINREWNGSITHVQQTSTKNILALVEYVIMQIYGTKINTSIYISGHMDIY